MWENFYEQRRELERDIGGQARRPILPVLKPRQAEAALAGRRPASPETPARRRQREQQSRMSACGRGNSARPRRKACGQLPARMSFCSLLPRPAACPQHFLLAASESKAAMKRPATRGGVAGAAASGGQRMQKQNQRTQKKPAAAQNRKLPEPLCRRVGWSRVTAAQLLECREDYQDAKAYNAMATACQVTRSTLAATSLPRSAPKTSSPKPCGST